MPRVAVVIPAYRCQAQLDALLPRLPADLPVYVVDDGSDPPLHADRPILRHPQNRGYGAAQKTGYTAALGSRFLADPSVIPGWRRLGNRVLTGLANLRYGSRHTELHTGARAFRAEALRSVDFSSFSDDYLFDQQMLCHLLRAHRPMAERPVRVRYDATTQSIPLGRAIRYAAGCLRVIATT